jgi:AcrR family transcriptional regulator
MEPLMKNQQTTLTEGQESRKRIIDEAIRLFVSRGYDGISMREIAEACHLSKAALYYHFKSKEDLFLAIMNESVDELTALLTTYRNQPGTTRARISAFVYSIFIDLLPEHRALIRLANQEMNKLDLDQRENFSKKYQKDFIGGIISILGDGIQSGELSPADPAIITWIFLGMLYPFFNPEFSRPPREMEPIIKAILDVFFSGVSITV